MFLFWSSTIIYLKWKLVTDISMHVTPDIDILPQVIPAIDILLQVTPAIDSLLQVTPAISLNDANVLSSSSIPTRVFNQECFSNLAHN